MAARSRTRQPVVTLHCPSCRKPQPCRSIGTVTLDGRRREAVECTIRDCGLQWLPTRLHHPDTAPQAA